METLYQVALSIVLLLFTRTETPTTVGLESFFEKNTFLGFKASPSTIITISVIWSLKTCVFLHVKSIRVEKKGFCGFKTTCGALFPWAVFATTRKVASIVIFFVPSLGLFSLLHHWQAENIPFKARLDMAKKSHDITHDNIELYNMTKTISWSTLDRWTYDDMKHPKAPPYTLYTGLSLKHTLVAFIGISILQMLLMLVVKLSTSEKFRERNDYFAKLTHIIQMTNLPYPYEDWDSRKSNSLELFKIRYKNTEKEMWFSFVVTFLVTLVMLAPINLTGNRSFYLSSINMT